MKIKEDLTMTNKQMLVAQLRKEQEQNRILRIELEKAKREKNFAERDAYAAICMFNDESRKVQSHINRHKAEIERLRTTLGQCNTELNSALESLKSQCREIGKLKAEVKQAQIDVLTELKKKYGFYICCSWCRATKLLGEIIDEFIEEIKNEQDTSGYTTRGGDRGVATK